MFDFSFVLTYSIYRMKKEDAMKLVIVESPTKCHTIQQFLGKDYEVVASMGHIRDLSTTGKGGLGVDIENKFHPTYVINKDKKKIVSNLLKEKKKADEVLLATDPDREGEAISWHLASVLELDVEKVKRLEFHEITKKAVTHAIENPRHIDMDLVASQETRRIIDRIMGFDLSNLLKKKIHSLSAGRVQSVALKLVCDREKEVQAFVPQKYYTIQGEFQGLKAKLDSYIGKEVTIKTEEEAEEILKLLKGKDFIVTKKKVSLKNSEPKIPFKTSSLQQAAFNSFHFSTKMTQSLAQRLFETGLITYIRTDGVGFAEEFISHGKEFIKKNYGEKYLAKKEKYFAMQMKENAKVAHEAIRPTSLDTTPQAIKDTLEGNAYRLYKLIYERSLAALMASKVEEITIYYLDCLGYTFRHEEAKLIFDGFKKVTFEEKDEDEIEKSSLQSFDEGESVRNEVLESEQHFTKGPVRYNEARLVKMMEDLGIGRPSTYASTISTLFERKYISVSKGLLLPTEQGNLTIERLTAFFPEFMDASFTAEMEKNLDDVTIQNDSRLKILQSFYDEFLPLYNKAKEEMPGLEVVYTGNICPKCGKPLVLRHSRYGTFEACSGFPECKYVKKQEKQPVEETDKICPKCGKPLVKRVSKRGEFYACSGFPKCRYIEGEEKEKKEPIYVDKVCPKCGKPLVLHKGKRNRPDFLACSGFPKCRYIESLNEKKEEN